MLIRLILKNIYSFKEETEFNLFPNKSQRLSHHKLNRNGIDFLRMSAIYGANGSGKSNMIKAVAKLEQFVSDGKVAETIDDMRFKLSKPNKSQPISIGVEFLANEKFYYYSLTFDTGVILNEYLAESKKDQDVLILERSNIDGTQSINFHEGYTDDPKNKLFLEILGEKLLQRDELLLSFLYEKYKDEHQDVSAAYDWFDKTLVVISPDSIPGALPHILDKHNGLMEFANGFLPTLNTGINKLNVKKESLDDFVKGKQSKGIKDLIDNHRKNPNAISILSHNETGEELAVANDNGDISVKRLTASHLDDEGEAVEFGISMESDGTKRLIEYIPAINSIINHERVYLIDEIERSIHPKTIKEIISKISLDENAKGQLIFTTHESCLLDQDILRPDEIWFAQKSLDGASKLYPLSDFNIHHTANIENGYLNGRFGGIPFLSNLQDLNWHKYAVSE
ncbi:MAG: ATP-binding protein [Chryseobacterium sp.]|nr:MAG: ATP-binding protein [Chryseobacterium sp.]